MLKKQWKHLLREATEAKITLDKVPSSTAAYSSNWVCVVWENVFWSKAMKALLSVSQSNAHISIYHCFSLNAQLPFWHRNYPGKQRDWRGKYNFGIKFVESTRNTISSPRPFTASICTTPCQLSHFAGCPPTPQDMPVSESEKNLFPTLFFSLCREVFQSRSQNLSEFNYSKHQIRHIV